MPKLILAVKNIYIPPPVPESVNFIHAGNYFNYGLSSYGVVRTLGNNSVGQLGDNTIVFKSSPVTLGGASKTFCKISGSIGAQLDGHGVAIDKYGKSWAWGLNTNGQLGDNSITSQRTPVSVLGASKTFCKISAGNAHTMVIDQYGQAWGWGSNSTGQLGDNTSNTSKRTPVSVLGASKTFCKISAGNNYTMAIDKKGRAWGWGSNSDGQVGDGTSGFFSVKLTPVSVAGVVKTFCQISSGVRHTMAIDKNGRAWGWGSNSNGQLGDNSITSRLTPVSVVGTVKTFCKISAGNNYTMAIDKNGKAWGWGNNVNGFIGDNSFLSKRTPVAVCGNKTFCNIKAGTSATIAIDKNGGAWSWGINIYGELGIPLTYTPVSVVGAQKTFCEIGVGFNHGFGITSGGRLWAWGDNTSGCLGNNSITLVRTPVSVLGTVKTFCKVVGGLSFSLAIDKNGRAWGWGLNGNGQLGNNSITSRRTPVSVLGGVKTFCRISAGQLHSLAIDKNGKAWAWGVNFQGRLGDNTIISKRTPVAVAGSTKTFCDISGGSSHSVAIDKNGRAWGWGNNNFGQIGDNSVTSRITPVSVLGAVKTFCQISAPSSGGHNLAIDKDGRVWSWGINTNGALGDNTANSRRTPVSVVGTVKTFCHVSAGSFHSLGIDKNGRVWAWGLNSNGQLGDGSLESKRTPISVLGTNKTFCHISAGESHSIAIDQYGQGWGWGRYILGQLGNNLNTTTPVSISYF